MSEHLFSGIWNEGPDTKNEVKYESEQVAGKAKMANVRDDQS